MVQVPRRQLKNEIREEISENLWIAISAVSKKEDVLDFIYDILSPAERLMIEKRLAVAILLLRGWKYDSIKEFLKVSNSTINSVRSNIERGGKGFRFIVEQLGKKKSLGQIIKKSEKSFGIMPPIVGRGRWAFLYRK